MKKIRARSGFYLFLLGLILILINFVFEIPEGEGFNPSDDGVILAQSFRILAGQIPHLDFISIRPVGSAIFHAVSFFSPWPLEVSARWITLLEYLLFSFLWSWILLKSSPFNREGIVGLICFSIIVFVLNQNHYNLFPWTTIDALLFFSLGFFIFWNWRGVLLSPFQRWIRYFLIILFSGIAALCRQSFALPALVLALVVFSESVKLKKYSSFISSLCVGLLPYWIYGWVMLKHDAFKLFFDQLTGRTEIWETGIVKFGQSFWSSDLLFLYLALIVMFLIFRFMNREGQVHQRWVKTKELSVLFLVCLVLILVFFVFLRPTHLFSFGFIFFWLLAIVLVVQPMLQNQNDKLRSLSLWVLFIAWTSSISLGDNAPVFTIGLLAGALLLHLNNLMQRNTWLKLQSLLLRRGLLILLSVAMIGLGIYGQKTNNYRDLDSSRLHFTMNEDYPGMGKIRTNPKTFEYLQEIKCIYLALQEPEGRFVVLPNASLIYPLLQSQNPMPLDWMQGPEFIGQEEELMKRLMLLDKGEGIYLLFDKINSKWMADTLSPMKYDALVYPYYAFLITESVQSAIKSDWFEVRVWK